MDSLDRPEGEDGMTPAEQVVSLRRAGRHDEARTLAVALAVRHPGDATLQYQAACVHDFLGLEARAVPYYLAGIAGTLSPEQLRSAYLGLGSTYRALGRYAEAERTLEDGLARFPDAAELEVFLAMALHNVGKSKQAVERLLRVLARTSGDAELQSYREAILLYAQDIERSWPDEA